VNAVNKTLVRIAGKDYYEAEVSIEDLENVLYELIVKENVDHKYITIIIDDDLVQHFQYDKIGRWKLISNQIIFNDEIRYFKTSSNTIYYSKFSFKINLDFLKLGF